MSEQRAAEPTPPERLSGAIWGHLLGDALGVPYEYGEPRDPASVSWGVAGSHGQPVGTWSDDGALMLATLDALLGEDDAPLPPLDPEDLASRFLAWRTEGAYMVDPGPPFDCGATVGAALDAYAAGAPALAAGRRDERSQGNGSLMRILPVALAGGGLPASTLVQQAYLASAVTHAHPVPMAACALYVLAARRLLAGEREPGTIMEAVVAELWGIHAGPDPADETMRNAINALCNPPERTGSGFVIDSFWSAWDAFARSVDYESAVRGAVAYGNDTDTTAALAGGLAGIRYGVGSIPGAWWSELRAREAVEPLIGLLIARVVR